MSKPNKKIIYFRLPRLASGAISTAISTNNLNIKFFNTENIHWFNENESTPEIYLERLNGLYHEIWDSAYKFVVSRNPWDRAISMWQHVQFHKYNFSFEQWCEKISEFRKGAWGTIEKMHTMQIYPYIVKDNKLIVNKILKFENIQEEFDALCEEFEFEKIELPFISQWVYDKSKGYKVYYNDKSKKLIDEYFSEDITLFDYTF